MRNTKKSTIKVSIRRGMAAKNAVRMVLSALTDDIVLSGLSILRDLKLDSLIEDEFSTMGM